MAARGAGVSSSERIASPSRSRSNVRPRPTVPDTTSATQTMPDTTAAGGRVPSMTKAKLKISTTTTARKVIVASTSLLRHSIARSLAAIRSAWRRNPAGRAPAVSATGGLSRLVSRPGLVAAAHRLGAEPARARLVEHHPPAPQDDQLVGHRRRRQIVGHQDDDAAAVAL